VAEILVLEGDTFARKLYCEFLREEGFSARGEPDLALLFAALEKKGADVIVASPGGAESYSARLVEEARRIAPGVDVIALIERGSPDGAARALRDGACEYLLKPVTQQSLGLAVRRAVEMQSLLRERPRMAREMALYRRCSRLLAGGSPEGIEERVASLLAEHASAPSAVVLRRGQDHELHASAHLGMSREVADKVAQGYGDGDNPKRSIRGLGEAMSVEVGGRFTVALFGATTKKGEEETLAEELALLARSAGAAVELCGRYSEAATAEVAIDPLSGLFDARYLSRVLTEEIARRAGGGPQVAVLCVDIDNFKPINDEHGHLTGGRALIEAARLLERCVREVDVLARTGGDEFTLVLLATDEKGARGAAERIRRAFESHLFLVREGLDLRMTVSIGVAACPTHGKTAEALIEAAESALGRLKAAGKNGVVVAG
jgi:diguanylate cyclase (GGDEF)-like protein